MARFATGVAARFMVRPRPSRRLLGLALISAFACVVSLVLVLSEGGGAVAAIVAATAALIGIGATAIALLRPTIAVPVLGVALGVSSLFTFLSATSGIEVAVVDRLARFNGHVLVTKYGLDFFEFDAVADRLRAQPGVAAVSPFVYGPVAVVDPRREGNDDTPRVAVVKGLDPDRARELSGVEEAVDLAALRPASPSRPPGVALGHRLAQRLGLGPGDPVRLVAPAEVDGSADALAGTPRHADFVVLGIVDVGLSDVDDRLVLTHLRSAQALLYGEGRVTGIEVALQDPRDAGGHAEAFERLLNRPNAPKLYRAGSWMDNAAILTGIRQLRAVVGAVVSLIIVLAGTSLVAALVLMVRRRRGHIAVLTTVGASPRGVFSLFEAVGVTSGALGAVAGLFHGGFTVWLLARVRVRVSADVYPLDYLPVEPHLFDALVPAAIAVVVSALVSGPIAARASRLDPVDGLRRA